MLQYKDFYYHLQILRWIDLEATVIKHTDYTQLQRDDKQHLAEMMGKRQGVKGHWQRETLWAFFVMDLPAQTKKEKDWQSK